MATTSDAATDSVEYEYEPDPDTLLESLVPWHIRTQVWRVLQESAAAEHAAPHARASLIGVAMFGIGVGTTFAPPIVAFLTLQSDWRWAFIGTGLMGFLWVVLWLLFYGSKRLPAVAVERHVDEAPWTHLFRDRRVIGLTLSHIFSASAWWFYLYWIPPFLNQERHLDIHDIGI